MQPLPWWLTYRIPQFFFNLESSTDIGINAISIEYFPLEQALSTTNASFSSFDDVSREGLPQISTDLSIHRQWSIPAQVGPTFGNLSILPTWSISFLSYVIDIF